MTLKKSMIGLLISFAIYLPAQGLAADTASPDELLFWESIKDSSNSADFEAYLTQYPNGRFVLLAKNRLTPSAAKSESTNAGQSETTEKLPSIFIDSQLGDGEKIELTIMTRQQVQNAIDRVVTRLHPKFYNFNTSAQYFNYLLNKSRRLSGKFFVTGNIVHPNMPNQLIGRTNFYTVPLVAIEENGETKLYVVDFYSAEKIYTLDDWKKEVLDKDASKITSEYITNQYHYTDATKNEHLTSMTPIEKEHFYDVTSLASIEITNY